jgi:hypothetical protein
MAEYHDDVEYPASLMHMSVAEQSNLLIVYLRKVKVGQYILLILKKQAEYRDTKIDRMYYFNVGLFCQSKQK